MVSFRWPYDFVQWYDCPGPRPFGNEEEIVNVDFALCAPHESSFYDQRYAQSPTTEPLSENMVRLVRSQLTSMFFECIASSYAATSEFQHGWWRPRLRRFDQSSLPPEFFVTPSPVDRRHLLEYADVHVAVYLDSNDDAYRPHGHFCSRKFGRYVFRKWFHWHDGRPPFLSHQRLAKPIGVKGGKARDIQSIRKFHHSLCDAVTTGLSQLELPVRLRMPDYALVPSGPGNLRTYKDRGRAMAHLFRAIVVVVDDQVRQHTEPEIFWPVWPPELEERNALAYLEKERDFFGSQDSVLLVKTGDDAHLSSPISFQSLFDSGKAFPAQRPDCDDIDVVRVRIDAALEFVLDLICREREAIPYVGLAAETDDRYHSDACEKWVEGVMTHAGEVGIDMNGFTWQAVRRAKAKLNGEAFDQDEVSPLWDHIGRTSLPFCLC